MKQSAPAAACARKAPMLPKTHEMPPSTSTAATAARRPVLPVSIALLCHPRKHEWRARWRGGRHVDGLLREGHRVVDPAALVVHEFEHRLTGPHGVARLLQDDHASP